MQPAENSDAPIVLFDGVCNLCHYAVQFIIRRDPKSRFRFASLQSEFGKEQIARHGLPEDLSTIILIEGQRCSTHSTAALRIARQLHRAWPLAYACIVLPRFLRDPIYRWVARNRYRWFGEKDQCPLPDPALAERFFG